MNDVLYYCVMHITISNFLGLTQMHEPDQCAPYISTKFKIKESELKIKMFAFIVCNTFFF